MNTNNFNKVVEKVFQQCKETLTAREALYGTNVDRLSQFKEISDLLDTAPYYIPLTLCSKHITALYKAWRECTLIQLNDQNKLLDLIVDIINYLVFTVATLEEAKGEDQ